MTFLSNPRLEDWIIVGSPSGNWLKGKVFNHPKAYKNPDGMEVSTTYLKFIDFEKKIAKTENTEYELGKRYGE